MSPTVPSSNRRRSRYSPIGFQLFLVQGGPFTDETEAARWERASKDGAVKADRRLVARVLDVEVRHRVLGLVPVHPDQDPVEVTDLRHQRDVSQ